MKGEELKEIYLIEKRNDRVNRLQKGALEFGRVIDRVIEKTSIWRSDLLAGGENLFFIKDYRCNKYISQDEFYNTTPLNRSCTKEELFLLRDVFINEGFIAKILFRNSGGVIEVLEEGARQESLLYLVLAISWKGEPTEAMLKVGSVLDDNIMRIGE